MQPSIQKFTKEAVLTVEQVFTPLGVIDQVESLLRAAQIVQSRAKTAGEMQQVVYDCCQALDLAQRFAVDPLLLARSLMALGSALRCLPGRNADVLVEARLAYMQALPLLREYADLGSMAALYLHLGGVLRELMVYELACIQDVRQVHEEGQRMLTGQHYPREYALLSHSLAIAYLSLPLHHPQRSLAVPTLQLALGYLSSADHPWEYALIQHNLGHALQSLPENHPLASPWDAIAAYDAALRVRNALECPLDYADTLVGKANVLAHLVDDSRDALTLRYALQARHLLLTAQGVFRLHQQPQQVQVIALSLAELDDLLNWERSA